MLREVVRILKRTGRELRYATQFPIHYRSENMNIFHCCVHKTASTWVSQILSDTVVYQYSGLTQYMYQKAMPGGIDRRAITERAFGRPFPEKTIVSQLYIDYDSFLEIPKPGAHKAFYVLRDPRDVTVSWYFSMKKSHSANEEVQRVRKALRHKEKEEGILYCIEFLADYGTFEAQSSWMRAGSDPNVLVCQYEDLTGSEQIERFELLFDFLDIGLPKSKLLQLLARYTFERLSGREKGVEDQGAHLRRGVAGDWKNHFDRDLAECFDQMTGGIVVELGYEKNPRWFEEISTAE